MLLRWSLNQNKRGQYFMNIVINEINLLSIIVGGIMYMIYGGIYYSILLGKKKTNGSEGPIKYIYSVLVAFVSSFLVAVLVQAAGAESPAAGLMIGFIIGLLISLVYFKNTLFGLLLKRSCLIAIGDHLVIFTLLGLLHGMIN
jgi:hypothetical protein